MPVAELARTNGHDLTDAEARAEAEERWRRSHAAGEVLTGAELGRAYGRTDRWGRKRIERARATDAPETASGGTPATVEAAAAIVPWNEAPAIVEPPGTAANAAAEDGTSMATPAERALLADTAPGPSLWDRLAVVAVGLIAAGASYGHMYEVAQMAGEHALIAKTFPLTVDGLGFIALRRGRQGRWWLALAIAVSIVANVAAAEPTIVGRLVAAWPPLSLLGCHRLLHGRQTDRSRS